jgi:hypothetical protein
VRRSVIPTVAWALVALSLVVCLNAFPRIGAWVPIYTVYLVITALVVWRLVRRARRNGISVYEVAANSAGRFFYAISCGLFLAGLAYLLLLIEMVPITNSWSGVALFCVPFGALFTAASVALGFGLYRDVGRDPRR